MYGLGILIATKYEQLTVGTQHTTKKNSETSHI